MMLRAATPVFFVLIVSGCFGAPTDDAKAAEAQTVDATVSDRASSDRSTLPTFTTHAASGHFTADALYVGADPASSEADLSAPVPPDATGLVAELRWDGEGSSYDLTGRSPQYCRDLEDRGQEILEDLECEARYLANEPRQGFFRTSTAPGEVGPGQLRLEFDAETLAAESCNQCEWLFVARWNVAVDSGFEIRVTVFQGGAPPEGFTAFTE